MKIRKIKKLDIKRMNDVITSAIENVKINKKMKDFLKKRYIPSKIKQFSKTSEMFVAEIRGKIQGTGKLKNKDGEIGMIYVTPNFQRKGLGSAMIDYLQKLAKKKKKKLVYIKALHPAIRFYEKLGFKKIKNNKDYCEMNKEIK